MEVEIKMVIDWGEELGSFGEMLFKYKNYSYVVLFVFFCGVLIEQDILFILDKILKID